ncbi:MAG TPA: ACT domain-containing protein [Candidatus Nanopelagicaceae bacterium]
MPTTQYQFTGLILLSANDKPGIEESLRAVLEPFTLEIREVQKIALRGRLILGVLIALDPAHASAVADDIDAFSRRSGLDVAIDYSDQAGQ